MKTYADIPVDGGSDIEGQVREQAGRMRARLADVERVVAIMSGKGGVGKSTLAANLAGCLAHGGAAVGLVDADINGPSIARITGIRGHRARKGNGGISPARAASGLSVMSMDLFLDDETSPVLWDAPTQTDAYAWRGLREAGALREMIADTDWGHLDYLFVDLPPGADRLPTLADVVQRIDGVVVVTIPSAISAAAVAKSIRLTRGYLNAQILGLVENMTAYECPNCGHVDAFFPGGAVERLAAELDVPVIARIPFDPVAAAAADSGQLYAVEFPDRAAARSIAGLGETIDELLFQPTTR